MAGAGAAPAARRPLGHAGTDASISTGPGDYAASHTLVGLVASGELNVYFLFWVSLYVAAGLLFEQPDASTWQRGLAVGGGVFALLMALLSVILNMRREAGERSDRAAELRQHEQADRAAALRQRLRGSCREGGERASGPVARPQLLR